jgi:class 3 adenylate cyclase
MADLPRGTVTFLFTDIEGSTALWERDRPAMHGAVARHLAILRDAVVAHGGEATKHSMRLIQERLGQWTCQMCSLGADKLPLRARDTLAVHADDRHRQTLARSAVDAGEFGGEHERLSHGGLQGERSPRRSRRRECGIAQRRSDARDA